MSTAHRMTTITMLGSAVVALAACSEAAPLDAVTQLAVPADYAMAADSHRDLAELRRVTARYHNVDAAVADDYVAVGECEIHEGESPAGIPYANFDYLLDGQIDPSRPDALLYEPGEDGKLALAGVELAVPYPLWSSSEPPRFLGETFRREDEMGVFGLHIWVWKNNPDGMLAWGNPRVSCGDTH